MVSHRYFIQLSYKGTNYFGWQVQPREISVQEVIERALEQLNSNEKIEITGCGRTDTGVHSSNYFAHFDIAKEIDTTHWAFKLNVMLPKDIAVKKIYKVDTRLHARYDAISRTYEYKIHHTKDPFIAETSWLYKVDLDLGLIESACKRLMIHSDFESFSKVKTEVSSFNCVLYHAHWEKTETGYLFRISANRFLRNMVRALVGTLLEVGLKKISLEEFENILHSKDRSKAGVSAPAHGLTLVNVEYPDGSV